MSSKRCGTSGTVGRCGMARREFLAMLGAGAAGLAVRRLRAAETTSETAPAARPRKPNFLVIVADDLGYADLGVHGCKDIPTPNIDSIARGGVRFTSGYVSCPVCSPTRAGLVTGRYQQRFGHEFNPGPMRQGGLAADFGLPLDETTIANVLKDAGYRTGMVGKWHLGADKHHPLQRGFEEYYGFLGGSHSYLKISAADRNAVLRGTEPVDEKEYLTDAFAREAVDYIERHRSEPFFLYLTFNAVHTPMEATEKYLSRFGGIEDKRRRTYAAMLSAMDDAVGRVLAKLREAGIEQDTLIFFISDNGGPPAANASRNDPLRGAKGGTYEGGIRVPFFIQWKGRLPEGKTFDAPVIALDILPTAAAAAGAKPPPKPLDGVDLLPYVTGLREGRPHEILFWRFGAQEAVRRGNWKLYVRGDTRELYNLAADVGESKDLAAEKPDLVKELSDALAKWESELAEPLWGPVQRQRRQQQTQGGGRRRNRRSAGPQALSV